MQPILTPTHIELAQLIAWNQKAQHLSLRALRIAALQGGSYLSRFRGRGMEFEEVRIYQPGDDIRSIDWRVTARTQKPHTKLYSEEKERPVLFCLDLQKSMFFSTVQAYKSVLGAHIAALLAWAACHHHDRVGSVIFDENTCLASSPTLREAGVLRFLNLLVKHPAWDQQSSKSSEQNGAEMALIKLRKLARPGSLIFWISDWHPINENALKHLRQLARHQDIVMIFLYDALEKDFPPPGHYPIEINQQIHLFDSQDAQARKLYQSQFEARKKLLAREAMGMRAKFVPCPTDANIFNLINNVLNEQ